MEIIPVDFQQKKNEGGEKVTAFDVVKQLKLNDFCNLMYGIVHDVKTQDELKEKMQEEIPEEVLQRINEAALQIGYQPPSFSG